MKTHDVFEHQRFLLRRQSPAGERFKLSFREIMTGKEEVDAVFDYPLEYMNVAALGLCAALTQTLFEPASPRELAKRLLAPISSEEFDATVEPLRDQFSIDGVTPFMQGREPERDKKGRLPTAPLSELIVSIKKGDKEILNRPDVDGVVALDQIPLLLFSRSTFFEKSAGRGYLTGTSGDLEIRTFPIDPASLRRTIWLNVLNQKKQEPYFHLVKDASDKDFKMWINSPEHDIAQGDLTLRSGLFWMVARAFIELQELSHASRCVVTGDIVDAGIMAGTGVVISATGVGYGMKEAIGGGPEVRRSFFHHPNGPTMTRIVDGKEPFLRHLSVRENSGLIGEMAGLFFSNDEPVSDKVRDRYRVAPVVSQLYDLKETYLDNPELGSLPKTHLLCFGFHMLSSKQNVHGGYESELFRYPVLSDSHTGVNRAGALLRVCADRTRKIEDAMLRAIQVCTLRDVDISIDIHGKQKFTANRMDTASILRDASIELWTNVGSLLKDLLVRIADLIEHDIDLADHEDQFRAWWIKHVVKHAAAIFDTTFRDYSFSPQHMVAAHSARRRFFSELRNINSEVRDQTPTSEEVQEVQL